MLLPGPDPARPCSSYTEKTLSSQTEGWDGGGELYVM